MGGIVMFNPQDVKMYDCDLLGNVLSGLDCNNGTGLDMNNCHCDENVTGNFATFGTFAIDIAFGANITTLSDTVNNIPGILDDIVIQNSTFNRNVAYIICWWRIIDYRKRIRRYYCECSC